MIRLPLDGDFTLALVRGAKRERFGRHGRGGSLGSRRRHRDAGVRQQRGIDQRDQRLNVLLFLWGTLRLLLLPFVVVVVALRQNGPGGAANQRDGDSQSEDATT